jgi:hypothetical protein
MIKSCKRGVEELNGLLFICGVKECIANAFKKFRGAVATTELFVNSSTPAFGTVYAILKLKSRWPSQILKEHQRVQAD